MDSKKSADLSLLSLQYVLARPPSASLDCHRLVCE